MKFQNIIFNTYTIIPIFLFLISCNKGILDRPPLTSIVDDNFWRNERDVRLFANGFYANYFIGYNTDFTNNYAPYGGYNFSDDLTSNSLQGNFENIVPATRSSTSEGAGDSWIRQHAGPTWNFAWIRKANIFIDRLENMAKPNLSAEEFNHWMAVARFFRAFEYSRLVSVFGDVPYFDRIVQDNDLDYMFKDRDDRGLVMDKVFDDFKWVLQNIRKEDGKQFLNETIAASFISRFMLFEGTFLHYHNLDAERAKKYLEFAMEASEVVMNSGQYSFTSDYKSLFASNNLDSNGEVIMWRTYDNALEIKHNVLTRSNGAFNQGLSANLNFVKSFVCVDGKPWQNSAISNASSFSIQDLVSTRDSRFEASFLDIPHGPSSSLFYINKYAPREVKDYIGGTILPEWHNGQNVTDAPVIRLAEVVLNWIEAKAVLAEAFGGAAIVQVDLDKSINAIRNRPLAEKAIANGVQKTAFLLINELPNDPLRDVDVSALMWEIRRERRIEFFLEHTRLLDLKRWKKIQYMDFSSNPDYFLGAWVDVQNELPAFLVPSYIGITKVQKQDGTVITYDGNNGSDMVGYFVIQGAGNRISFGDEVYLAPVGEREIIEYAENGYILTQTINW